MVRIFYDKDADISLLKNKLIGIVGYGSQGHAHALNLKDSGLNVMVGLYKGSKSWPKAEQEGLKVAEVADVAKQADMLMMLVPDMAQRDVYVNSIAPNVRQGQTLMFAHGFNIHFKRIVPDRRLDVTMVAPKAPGHRMRDIFKQGLGVPSLVAEHQDVSGKALPNALAYAKGIGSMRAGVIETTFKEETETDLFGEQTVLCGGVSALVKTAFETLVKAGYQPEIAYFECMHELKLIVDLLYQGGLAYMRYSVSDTAEYGDYTRGPMVVDAHVRQQMEKILTDIQNGTFAREWIAETDEGQKKFLQMRERERHHQIEEVGEKLRSMMPWLQRTT